MKARTGIAAASPSAQIVRPWMLSATRVQQVEVLRLALAVLDAMDDAVQPAGALAARRALAAALPRRGRARDRALCADRR